MRWRERSRASGSWLAPWKLRIQDPLAVNVKGSSRHETLFCSSSAPRCRTPDTVAVSDAPLRQGRASAAGEAGRGRARPDSAARGDTGGQGSRAPRAALVALRGWFEEWSTAAKSVVKKKSHLIPPRVREPEVAGAKGERAGLSREGRGAETKGATEAGKLPSRGGSFRRAGEACRRPARSVRRQNEASCGGEGGRSAEKLVNSRRS